MRTPACLIFALAWIGFVPADGVFAAEPNVQAAAKRVKQIIAHRGASAERPECTLAAIKRAIEVGATAVEVDVRTSRDGKLFILHDATLDRTTDGKGPANALSLSDLQKLDAGSFFDSAYRNERIPSLIEAAQTCRARIDLLLDLKEQGTEYDARVAEVIRTHGDPQKTIIGVRSVAQARRFRELLPQSRQLALIPTVNSIEAFAEAGVDTIRLWPQWIQQGDEPVRRVRATGKRLHLNGTLGELGETLALLAHQPDSLSSDDPGKLRSTLIRIARGELPEKKLGELIEAADGTQLQIVDCQKDAITFLNREYRMLKVPAELHGMPRYAFAGGEGERIRLRFRQPAVVFAVFEYNDSGLWSFEDGRSPSDFGWHLWRTKAYHGSSNPERNGKPNLASIWFREFKTRQELTGLPQWWLCLGVTDLKTAKSIAGFQAGLTSNPPTPVRRFSHAEEGGRLRPLAIPEFKNATQFDAWRQQQRDRFQQRMLYPYHGKIAITGGRVSEHKHHRREEFMVMLDGKRLFRYFRLEPLSTKTDEKLPAVVCFMGHGKVAQILDEPESYQHACATRFAEAGYLAFAMENVGMEPGRDSHHDLDQSLRLEGRGWYSLLFAHQRILLDRVFADPKVDPNRVGSAGVSTGGLLALSAAVLETRITAASVQGIFGSMRVSFIRDRHRHCKCGAIPGLLPEFDLPELALLVAPRALHISNGKTDGFSPQEAKRCVDLITPLIHRYDGTPPKFTVSPGGHEFALDTAMAFFHETLRRDSDSAD